MTIAIIASRYRVLALALSRLVLDQGLSVGGVVSSFDQAQTALAKLSDPLLICTEAMEAGHGIDLILAVQLRHPQARTLLVLTSRDTLYDPRLLKVASSSIVADWDIDLAEEHWRVALQGLLQSDGPYRSPSVRKALATNPALGPRPGELAQLTRREQLVLKLILEGMSNREIAEALYLSPATAKSYSRDVMRKLGVSNRQQALLLSMALERPQEGH